MHILLIDDSSSTRSLLRTLINSGQSVRHEISEAASGEEALQKVGSGEINLPDLIILDINMGGMSGFELCREIRQRYKTTSDLVPYVIIVTANEGVDVINQALESGANDYMPKPVNVKVLQVRLRVAERLLAQVREGGGGQSVGPPPGFVDTESVEFQAAVAAAVMAARASEPPPAPLPPPPAPVLDPESPEFKNAVDAAVADAMANIPPPPASEPIYMNGSDPRESQIATAIDQADAPIALVETDGTDSTFRIAYANSAMMATTQFEYDQLMGRSLAELEAWTPDFLDMTMDYVNKGAILSHVPLWSRTRQSVPVHLSFYPIRSADEVLRHYLVIHHF